MAEMIRPGSASAAWASFKRSAAYYLLLFIEGDHNWGQLRFMVALSAIGLFLVLSRLLEVVPPMPALAAYAEGLGVPPPLERLVEVLLSFLLPQIFRHLIPPLIGFLLALFMGARYLRDLLELPGLGPAYEHLNATLFGGSYPQMTINEGQISVRASATNPLPKIGGPGWVVINLGSAALFERVAGPSAVRGAGRHFLRRFETLRDVFDLREMERAKTNVQVFTRDGLPLVLDEVRVRFRLRTRGTRTEADPYPVLASAVRQAVYTRKVSDKGLENWPDMILGAAVGTITGWLARRRMDELVPPPAAEDGDDAAMPSELPYRQALHNLFLQNTTRQRFAEMGAEVLWVSVGHLRPDPDIDPEAANPEAAQGHDKIHGQMIDTWKSQYLALMKEEMADARGYAEWLAEIARAQVQVEMIQKLTEGLKEAQAAGVSVPDLIAARGTDYFQALGQPQGGPRPMLAGPRGAGDDVADMLKTQTGGSPAEKKA